MRKYRRDSRSGGEERLPDGGVIQNTNTDFFQYDWKAQGEINKTFNRVHELDVMVGLEMRGNKNTSIHTKGFGFDPKTLTTKPIYFPEGSSTANEPKFVQYRNSFLENRFLSYFATAGYTYDSRFTFYGSMRYDGSNLFGVDPKYKFTPLWSASGAWSINRESWLRNKEWLSNLRLRLSYGVQGNIDKSTSPFIIGKWQTTTILPNGVKNEQTINVTSPPNQNLRWETTKTWNAAVDFGVLDGRINLTLEAYHRVSDNLIALKKIPQENGFNFTTTNFGKITNKGIEFSIYTTNIATKNFRWEMNFNLARNKSTVNRIDVREDEFFPSKVGLPTNAVFGIRTAGLDEDGLPLFWKNGQKVPFEEFFNVQVKDDDWGLGMRLVSYDHSAKATRERMTYLGDADPKLIGGFNNKFFFKNFDLSIGMNFIINQLVSRAPFYRPTQVNPGLNYTNEVFDIWSQGNTSGKYPMIPGAWTDSFSDPDRQGLFYEVMDNTPIDIWSAMDIWYKRISYIRINSIRLGYTLPDKALRKMRIASLRIQAEVRNPFVIGTDYTGYFDPETYGNIYAQPMPRTFSVGVNLTF